MICKIKKRDNYYEGETTVAAELRKEMSNPGKKKISDILTRTQR